MPLRHDAPRPCLFGLLALLLAALVGAHERPNVVLVMADDFGWGDLGAFNAQSHSGETVPPVTPNLDRLVREGTSFTHFRTTNPVCSPSRASWMTSRFPSAEGVQAPFIYQCTRQANAQLGVADWLNLSTPVLTRELRSAGYLLLSPPEDGL